MVGSTVVVGVVAVGVSVVLATHLSAVAVSSLKSMSEGHEWDPEISGEKASGAKNPQLTQESINSKLDGYLLNKDHPVGGSKANWFEKALGFNKNNSQQLSKQIIFDKSTAVQTAVTDYGTKYSQIIPIKGVNGKIIDVEFVWIKNNDRIVRLVTSIPTKK